MPLNRSSIRRPFLAADAKPYSGPIRGQAFRLMFGSHARFVAEMGPVNIIGED